MHVVVEDQKRVLADEGLVQSFISFSQFVSACISVKKEETMVWFQMK